MESRSHYNGQTATAQYGQEGDDENRGGNRKQKRKRHRVTWCDQGSTGCTTANNKITVAMQAQGIVCDLQSVSLTKHQDDERLCRSALLLSHKSSPTLSQPQPARPPCPSSIATPTLRFLLHPTFQSCHPSTCSTTCLHLHKPRYPYTRRLLPACRSFDLQIPHSISTHINLIQAHAVAPQFRLDMVDNCLTNPQSHLHRIGNTVSVRQKKDVAGNLDDEST
ncbi:hypothetical protein B0O80DRAFT_266801 [Mortierella sp. GBAus27b]|nr:hypothetical protein B0O80DRAFT_266801 [Mortierella sp. GBAus27b]